MEETAVTSAVLAAHTWPSNAELIVDVAKLGYLRLEWRTLDPTYENGVWWKLWRPDELVTQHRAIDGSDFRDLPYPDGHFDAIAYDPPYVAPGGVKTSTAKDFHDRFGMAEGRDDERLFSNPTELQQMIDDGLTEMWRLVRHARGPKANPDGGIVLVKCMDYNWGGRLWLGVHKTVDHALKLGFEVEAKFLHVGTAGMQPKKNPDGSARRQVHPRSNASTLLVFRKPKPAKAKKPAEPTLDLGLLT